MAVANAGNYGFNLVMAFLLGPEAYGALAALLALVLVGSVPGLALLAVLAGPGLVLFLHLDGAAPVLWLAVALAPTPLLFAVQGLLQGRERFGALAAVMVAGAAVKLATGLALVAAGLGVDGAMAGVAAGALLAALAGLRLATPASAAGGRRGRGPRAGWWGEVGAATTGLLGLLLLANLDVLLARHYLDRAAAGRYALGAVVAKVAFWAPQFLVTVIFPRLAGGADPRRLLGASALVIGGFGGLLAAGLAGADRVGLAVPVLGSGYAGLGPLLPVFAALGTGLALVQLLLFEGIATRDRGMGRAVVAALVGEVALVAGLLHGSPGQVAGAALAVVTALAATGWWLLHRRLARPQLPAAP